MVLMESATGTGTPSFTLELKLVSTGPGCGDSCFLYFNLSSGSSVEEITTDSVSSGPLTLSVEHALITLMS